MSNSTTNQALEILNKAKDLWSAAYEAAASSKTFKNNKVGKTLLLIQSTTGSAIVNTVNSDTWDEQLVELAGDALQSFALTFLPFGGVAINVSLLASGNSFGSKMKSLIKSLKSETAEQYYTYHKDYSVMIGGVMVTYPYVKMLHYKNGDAVWGNALNSPIIKPIYQTEYDNYIFIKKQIEQEVLSSDLNTKIELQDNVIKVTMPDGKVYAQTYDITKPSIVTGKEKDDILLGGNQDDILIGNDGADILKGGKGYDKYFTNHNDEITDSDGKGEVWFNNKELVAAFKNNNRNDKYFYTTDGGYFEITGKGLKYTSSNNEVLIINSPNVKTGSSNINSNTKLKYETLGIKLYEIDGYNDNNSYDGDDDNGDNTAKPKFVIFDILDGTTKEGDEIKFIITLSKALDKDLILNLTTRDDSAIGGEDYISQNATITIPKGTVKYIYGIPTIKDGEIEKVERFFLDGKVVNLSDFTDENGKAYINQTATGQGKIIDSDSVSLSVSNPTVNEKDGKAIFNISLSRALNEDLNLAVSTHDKTATSPMDFTQSDRVVTIKAGQTSYDYAVELFIRYIIKFLDEGLKVKQRV